MSKKTKLLKTLRNGRELTANQIAANYGASNPYDLIYRLRQDGERIYMNQRTNSKGAVLLKYRWNAI
jgi:hypothetical protein